MVGVAHLGGTQAKRSTSPRLHSASVSFAPILLDVARVAFGRRAEPLERRPSYVEIVHTDGRT